MGRRVERRAVRVTAVGALAGVLLWVGGAFAALGAAAERGWGPVIALMGKGDRARALRNLRAVADAWGAALHRLDVDPHTARWIAETWESFEDFDLDGFYESLPERRNDRWRRLAIYGELRGGRYKVQRAAPGGAFEVRAGTRDDLADMSAVLRAKPIPTGARRDNYLVHGRMGLGVGELDWQAVVDALGALLRVAGEPPASPPSAEARRAVARAHPRLAPREVALAATFWDAFPAVSEVVARVARVDALLAPGDAQQGLVHVKGAAKLKLEAMEARYEELADFLDDMGELLHARLRVVDRQGRTLLKLRLRTGDMSLGFELYARDGKLLPFSRRGVYADAPIDWMGEGLSRLRARAQLDMKVMGLKISLKGLQAHLRYRPSPSSVRASASITQVPGIEVSGAAMGIFPPGLIDIFIPSNMEQICRDFLTVATRGNEGRGIALAASLETSPAGRGALETTVGLEALNNFFVKFGMGIAADRILPDEEQEQDMKRLMGDLHRALLRDLSRFANTRPQAP